MKPVYYKSADSYFKGLKKASDIFHQGSYVGVETQVFNFVIFTNRAHSKEELEKYWEPSSEEEFNEALIEMTEHLKGL